MSVVVAEAPGKAVLLGEYAVLDGAPGLVMAVNRRARVRLETCAAGDCRVETPQLGTAPAAFGLNLDGSIEWRHAPEAAFARTAALVEYLVNDLHQRGGGIAPFRLRIDTADLFHAGPERDVKLGLGSSAAVAVALDAALRQAFGAGLAPESGEEIIRRLLSPGRRAQGDAGSGIDLAASLTGGLSGYRLDGAEIALERLYLPPGLKLVFVWTGSPASTTDLLAAWQQARHERPDALRALRDEMTAVAEAGLAAVRADDAAALVDCIGAYGRIMGKMNSLMSAPVVTPAHRRALEQAGRLGAAYKPCGAGGGDLGVAASTDSGTIARLTRTLERAGLAVLPLEMTRRGATVERE